MSFDIKNVSDKDLAIKMQSLTQWIESFSADTISEFEERQLCQEKAELLTEFYRRKFGEVVRPLVRK